MTWKLKRVAMAISRQRRMPGRIWPNEQSRLVWDQRRAASHDAYRRSCQMPVMQTNQPPMMRPRRPAVAA